MPTKTPNRLHWLLRELDDTELDQEFVRDVLLVQHDRLRELLATLDERAADVIRAEPGSGLELREAVENLAQALTDHMRGEEHALATLMPLTPASGQALAYMREEHVRQRTEIEAMRSLASSSADAIRLALTVGAFVAAVRIDMELEESQ